jgi:hypothetical protein
MPSEDKKKILSYLKVDDSVEEVMKYLENAGK